MAPEHDTDASAEDPETDGGSMKIDPIEAEAFLVELGIDDAVIDTTPPHTPAMLFRPAEILFYRTGL